MSDDLEIIIGQVIEGVRLYMTSAYEAGRKAGRDEAVSEFKAKLSGILDIGDAREPSAKVQTPRAEAPAPARAAPGSVKPAILKVIKDSRGLTLRDIEQITGFKYNSVRGTLWQLQQEGEIEKVGDWFRAATQKDETVDADPRRESSTVSISNPAQGREAGPGGST